MNLRPKAASARLPLPRAGEGMREREESARFMASIRGNAIWPCGLFRPCGPPSPAGGRRKVGAAFGRFLDRVGVRGKIVVKLPLILSFSRREKEPNECRGAHYLPFSSVSCPLYYCLIHNVHLAGQCLEAGRE